MDCWFMMFRIDASYLRIRALICIIKERFIVTLQLRQFLEISYNYEV